MKRIYLDYAATTPVDPAVFEFMKPYFTEKYGNSGSLHFFGQEAIAAVDHARETIAKSIGLSPASGFREVIFTSSATEANNLALRGVIKNYGKPSRILISSIEHESVLETARDLEKDGVEVICIPVDKHGVVDLKKIEEALNERTTLVSVMHASNEIGTIQPLREISKIILRWNNTNKNSPPVIFHTDAAQTLYLLDCNVDLSSGGLGVDLMTMSSQKIYGPKGAGALYIREGIRERIVPIITGGSHEFGIRAGTPNVPAIVGFGKAVELFSNSQAQEAANKKLGELREYFLKELKKISPEAEINSPPSLAACLPSIINIYFPNHLAEEFLIKLDMAGIAIATGSACSARSSKQSHVLKALGLSRERILRSVRFSFGKFTTKEEIKEVLERLKVIV